MSAPRKSYEQPFPTRTSTPSAARFTPPGIAIGGIAQLLTLFDGLMGSFTPHTASGMIERTSLWKRHRRAKGVAHPRWSYEGMLLIRTTETSPELEAFMQALATASGLEAAFLADERTGSIATEAPKVSITYEKITKLGLYAPADVGWSCGDYGLYIAQAEHPSEPFFWLIEHDVRFAGDAAIFFQSMATRSEDLLTSRLQPADRYWWWTKTVQARDAKAFRCFFPLERFSSTAISLMLRVRQHHSRQLIRRRLWPNDEAFVSTTIANSQLSAADFNGTARQYYDDLTWTYDNFFRTADVPGTEPHMPPRLYHPVLSDANIERRRGRMAAADSSNDVFSKVRRKFYAALNRHKDWYPRSEAAG